MHTDIDGEHKCPIPSLPSKAKSSVRFHISLEILVIGKLASGSGEFSILLPIFITFLLTHTIGSEYQQVNYVKHTFEFVKLIVDSMF